MVAPFENARFSSVNLVEAMAYGCPHIVTAIGEPAELAQAWKTGAIVPVGDVSALAAAMEQLASDRERLAALARRARNASGNFTTAAVARRLTHVYSALVQGTAVEPVGVGDAVT